MEERSRVDDLGFTFVGYQMLMSKQGWLLCGQIIREKYGVDEFWDGSLHIDGEANESHAYLASISFLISYCSLLNLART